MKINEAIINNIAESGIKVLWEHFNLLNNDDYDDFSEDYEKVRFGYSVRFSIYDIWENRVYMRGSKVHVFDPETGYKMKYSREDYRTEVTKRLTMMRQRLYENMTTTSLLEDR